jgi:4-aminobutyrate aminotransferase
MKSLYERSLEVFPPVAGRATTIGVKSAKGSYIFTEDGRKILDFASGVAVCNVGHNNDKVVEAAIKQMKELIHAGHNVAYYESYVALGEKLVELTGGDTKVYFSNSGAEANEGAIKLAKYVTKRSAVIAFKGAFHGRTLATTSITTSNSAYRKNYEGLLPSVYFAEYPNLFTSKEKDAKAEVKRCMDVLEDMFHRIIDPSCIAAMILEPVQGEGGYIVPPVDFIKEIRKICDKHGILLIFDEIQTGFGRTGKMFAYENFGVRPDIFTCAKAIASGFPLSAVIARRELMDEWKAGAHGGTFGGNPVACAAALATIEELESFGVQNAAKMGDYLKEKLVELQAKYELIGDVRGLGLMIGMEIVDKDNKPDAATQKKIVDECLNNGLLLLNCGSDKNVIRFIAPTTVSTEELDEAVNILEAAIAKEV